MVNSSRGAFAVVLIGTALLAAAMTPAHSTGAGSQDFMGSWVTWTDAANGAQPVCRRLQVTAGDGAVRYGGWDAPGWNGLVKGALTAGREGRPVLRGEWRDGRIAGAFALELRARDAFEGTFAAPGADAPEPWHGRRDTGANPANLPCAFER
jgi:hypothetical protein